MSQTDSPDKPIVKVGIDRISGSEKTDASVGITEKQRVAKEEFERRGQELKKEQLEKAKLNINNLLSKIDKIANADFKDVKTIDDLFNLINVSDFWKDINLLSNEIKNAKTNLDNFPKDELVNLEEELLARKKYLNII